MDELSRSCQTVFKLSIWVSRVIYHNSFSVGVLAEQTSLSAEAPRK